MNEKDSNKIINSIVNIIEMRIPNKIKKLENKYGVGLHTCNLSSKIKLSNNDIIEISVNTYLNNSKDTNGGSATGNFYDIFIGDYESSFVQNHSNSLDEYFHDLDDDSDYYIMEKICEKINTKNTYQNDNSESISITEILGTAFK